MLKIVLFQNDGTIVTAQMTKDLIGLLPITVDCDEAQDAHMLLCKEILAQNQKIMPHAAELTACIKRIKEYTEAHTEKEEDILGDEAKVLFEKVLQQLN